MMTRKRPHDQARKAPKRPRILPRTNDEHRALRDDDDFTLHGRPRCHGVRNAGGRCQGFAGKSGYCFTHDPATTPEARHEARMNAGPGNRLVKMMPTRLRPVFDELITAMKDVVTGKISPSQATALASLATASVRVLLSGELEERLRAIDAATATDDDGPTPMAYDDG